MIPRFPDGARAVARAHVISKFVAGRWAPGDPIMVSDLASELHLSPSPVREALATLAGEGMLEARHRDGYSVPRLMPHDLADEYRVMGCIADWIVSQLEPQCAREAHGPHRPSQRTRHLFTMLAAASQSRVALTRLNQSCVRISRYLDAEAAILHGWNEEISNLECLLIQRKPHALREALRDYFSRRLEAVVTLCRVVE